MDETTVLDTLNELLAGEQRAFPARLVESAVFLSPAAVGVGSVVRQMAEQSAEHAAWLTDLILDLGGVPVLRSGDVTSADLHFQELRRTLPRLISEHEALLRKYSVALGRLVEEARVREVVSRIRTRHERHLETLKQSGAVTPSV